MRSENSTPDQLTRRAVLAGVAAVPLAAAFSAQSTSPAAANAGLDRLARPDGMLPISLNTSTLRGHKLPITELIDIAARAGYQGIEPWPDDLDRYLEAGGDLRDLAKLLGDRGLAVTGAIAFHEWMVDDDVRRTKALEEARRRLEQLARLGATHMAAPPAGEVKGVDLLQAAERYRTLLELAAPFKVVPALEVWGFAANLNRLGQVVLVAVEADHPDACVLPDVYHLFKGGSSLTAVRLLSPRLLAGFHLNDYPADLPRERIADRDRVYPGDGVAPLRQLFVDLRDIGYRGPVSIELFNPAYYQQDPLVVAETALRKTRALMSPAMTP